MQQLDLETLGFWPIMPKNHQTMNKEDWPLVADETVEFDK